MRQFALLTSTLSILAFGGVWVATGTAVRANRPALTRAAHASIYYPGCDAVRAAGNAPLYRGQPGYRPEMDGDGDGIACEPHRAGGVGSVRYAGFGLRARSR